MLRIVALAGVVVGLVVSTIGSMVRLSHAPDPVRLDAVAEAVRAAWREGDVLVASPPWLLGVRSRLGDRPMLDGEALSEQALWRYRRVMIVTEPAIWAPPNPVTRLDGLGTVSQPADGQPEALTIVDLGPERRVVFDAYRQVRELRVTAFYADAQEPSPCERWDRDRWSCPRDAGWSYVGRQMYEIGGAARECLWLHPLAAGSRLEVALPILRATGDLRLVGGAGFTANGARSARAPVRLTVRDGEQVVLETEHPRSFEWRTFDVALGQREGHEVVVSVTSRDNGAAHFCADLLIVSRDVETGGR